ncbi:MAG: hypothetical protein AB9897_01200 [Anaerolineaceae bacterium]
MAPRLKWHVADDDRDQTAELINKAAENLESVSKKVAPEIGLMIMASANDLQKGLRLLERNGARTRVPDSSLMIRI